VSVKPKDPAGGHLGCAEQNQKKSPPPNTQKRDTELTPARALSNLQA